MSIKPEYFDYLKHFGATRTLDDYSRSSGPAIALRHDVDYSLDTALEMAYWEAENGIRATYFLLHTAPYWQTDRFTEKCAQLLAFGHEIGLHINLIPAWYDDGVAPEDTLNALLECLREAGAVVRGSSAHGDPLCYKNGFINYWIFSELRPDDPAARESIRNAEGIGESDPKRQIGYPAQHTLQAQQGRYPLWAVSMRDHGIEYEASHLDSDAYFSDSGGSWKRTADPLTCDLSGTRCQVLMHPIHWRGDPKVYFFLSTARSGSKWLAQMLDTATACRGVHEYTLNHRNNEKEGGSPVADKRTGIGLVDFIKDRQAVTSRLAHTNDVIANATCDYAEANVYLPLVLPALSAQFPDATLVHLHRNPEDVVLSVMKRGWYDTPDDDRHPRIETIPNWDDLAPLEKCCHYVAETHRIIQQQTDLRLSFESMVSDAGYFRGRLRQLGIAYYPLLAQQTFDQRINENDIAIDTASEGWNDRERRMYRDICGLIARKLGYSLIARSPPGKAWRMLRDRIDVGWQRIIRLFSKPSVELLAAEDSDQLLIVSHAVKCALTACPTGFKFDAADNESHASILIGTRSWSKLAQDYGWKFPLRGYLRLRMDYSIAEGTKVNVFVLMYDEGGALGYRRLLGSLPHESTSKRFSFARIGNFEKFAIAVYLPKQDSPRTGQLLSLNLTEYYR